VDKVKGNDYGLIRKVAKGEGIEKKRAGGGDQNGRCRRGVLPGKSTGRADEKLFKKA